MTFKWSQLQLISVLLLSSSYFEGAYSSSHTWYQGCYTLRPLLVEGYENITLSEILERPPAELQLNITQYYTDYNTVESQPLYGSTHCSAHGFEYVVILNDTRFYCIDSIELLEITSNRSSCDVRCSGDLPCGSSQSEQLEYASIYMSSLTPRLQQISIIEPNKQFTARLLLFTASIHFNHPFGLELDEEDPLTPVPVYCEFSVINHTDRITKQASQDNSIPHSLSYTSQGTGTPSPSSPVTAVCNFEAMFTYEDTYEIAVVVRTAWDVSNETTSVQISHEYPTLVDIVSAEKSSDLPTCLPTSLYSSLQSANSQTPHQPTTKVYVGVPTRFTASVGQGINMTFLWSFNEEGTVQYINDTINPQSCSTQCYQSEQTHTFSTAGLHHVQVNFTNPFGSSVYNLTVIAVQRNIVSATLTYPDNQYAVGFYTPLNITVEVQTSLRYYTYIEIDMGDGYTQHTWGIVDDMVWRNIDNRPNTSYPVSDIISSIYEPGDGCLFRFNRLINFISETITEGEYTVSWSVYNVASSDRITGSLAQSFKVYKDMRSPELEGARSYELGSVVSIRATWPANQISQYRTVRWQIKELINDNILYETSGPRADLLTYTANQTGQFRVICSVWNQLTVSHPLSEDLFILITEPLGALHVSTSQTILKTQTHSVLTFTASLESGVGAEFVWNATSSQRGSVAHIDESVDQLNSTAEITFIKADTYTINVYAKIGNSTTDIHFVRIVQVIEPITHITCTTPSFNPSGCGLTLNVRTGSHIDLLVQYPNHNITRRVSGNQTAVQPPTCPTYGSHRVLISASNEISTLEVVCHVIVKPRVVGHIPVDLTASYNMQLEAVVRSDSGRGEPVNAVYIWRYNHDGPQTIISALPFTMFTDLPPGTNVSASLEVHGLNGGVMRKPATNYQQRFSLLQHDNIVKPDSQINITVRNVYTYNFDEVGLSVFSSSHTFDLTSVPEPTYTTTSGLASVSDVTLNAGGDTISSKIASVSDLPPQDRVVLQCPTNVIANSDSQIMIGLDMGVDDFEQYYGYYTWYLNEVQISYTAIPSMFYSFTSAGVYNITVDVINHWSNFTKSCQITATQPLIHIKIEPTLVTPLSNSTLIMTSSHGQTREATDINVIFYGGVSSLSNLTIDFGDGVIDSYNIDQVHSLAWQHIDGDRSKLTFSHTYYNDKQYRVFLTAASTDQTTLNAFNIVYRSISGLTDNRESIRLTYEPDKSQVIWVKLNTGDHLNFEWSAGNQPITLLERSGRYSKARITFHHMTDTDIKVRISNPGSADGVIVKLASVHVQTKPLQGAMNAKINNVIVTSARLENGPQNVTFSINYAPGPDNAEVLWTFSDDSSLSGGSNNRPVSRSTCVNNFVLISCSASVSHTFSRVGVYNISAQVQTYYPSLFIWTTRFEILPLLKRIRFQNYTKLDSNMLPLYHFHKTTDTAVMVAYLQTPDIMQGNISYRWQFGDESVEHIDHLSANAISVVTHNYESMKEAGFTVTVTATPDNGLPVSGQARVIIYQQIQRVEISVNDKNYTESNEGYVYFIREAVEDREMLIKIRVLPAHVPFEICHLVHSVESIRHSSQSQPYIRKSFLPENTDIPMYDQIMSFGSTGSAANVKAVKVYAMCSEVRLSDGTDPSIQTSETITYSARREIINVRWIRKVERGENEIIAVGHNVTYQCDTGTGYASFSIYLNGTLMSSGQETDLLTFTPNVSGLYNLTCIADNVVSVKQTVELVPVIEFWCDMDLNIRHKRSVDPFSWIQQHWYRSDSITLKSDKKFRECNRFSRIWSMSWSIKQQLSNSRELIIPITDVDTHCDDLYLPARTLSVGDYIITAQASISGLDFVKTSQALIKVTRTPIKAIISAGLGRKINFATVNKLITLNASRSYDPDCPQCELKYIWSCYVENQEDKPCFSNHSGIMFAESAVTEVNTSLLVVANENRRVYVFVLVVLNGQDYSQANQIWEQFDQSEGAIGADAVCESCIDGPNLRASPSRPIVIRGLCPFSNCDDAKYRWLIEKVPTFSKQQPSKQIRCRPRTEHIYTTAIPTTPVTYETTTSTMTTATTPTPVIQPGVFIPSEGRVNVQPFPIPEEGGTGGHGQGGSTTTGAPNFWWPESLGYSQTARVPVPTTPEPTTPSPAIPDCQCAGNYDADKGSYDPRVYTENRNEIFGFKSLNGVDSKDLIIAPDVLDEESVYVITLTVDSGDETGVGYHVLNTSYTPREATCWLAWLDRWPDGGTYQTFPLEDEHGTELDMEYLMYCEAGRGGLNGSPRDDHEYFYWFETYIERIPGQLELIKRGLDQADMTLPGQRLPAGFRQYDYQVNFTSYVVDIYGNRIKVCDHSSVSGLRHRILPLDLSVLNTTISQYVYDLVEPSSTLDTVDWYDSELSQGNVFYSRTSMLGLSDMLNRAADDETEQREELVWRRRQSRSMLLKQLNSTPYRYMAEVEQQLNVLKSLTHIKSELYSNITGYAADMLYNLTQAFAQYSRTVEPFNISVTADAVYQIGSALISITSKSAAESAAESAESNYDVINKMDHSIGTLLTMSLNSDYIHTDRELTQSINGMSIHVNRYSTVKDETIKHGKVSFNVPAKLVHHLGTRTKDCYSAHMIQYPDNPYASGVTSTVSALTLYDCEGDEITDVRTDDSEAYVTFNLPLVQQYNQTFSEHSLRKENMNIHEIPTTSRKGGQALNIVIRFNVLQDHTFPIAVLIRKDEEPKPHKGDYDKMIHIHRKTEQHDFFFSNEDLGSAQKLYIGLSDVNFNEGEPRQREITVRNYSIFTYWSECVYWDSRSSDWSSQGCNVTQQTALTSTHCSCNHLTAFSSRREVVIAKLNTKLIDDFFSTKHYPTTTVLVALSVLMYMILAIVSYIADTKSPVQEKVIAIQDNSPSDRQRYIITIETGSEPGCGTTSKVSLVLHGEVGMSETRELIAPPDSDTHVFQSNSRDTFLLTLPSSLGPIWKVQLWHNNKGSSPGWYVKRVTVRDVDSGQSYYFLCESWLAVEECDGKVEREFMALDSHIGFSVVFKVKAPQYFNDYHLLRSLIYKPTYSHFSRVERLTCLWVGLLSHMALCTLYYEQKVEEYRGQYNLYDLSSKTVLVSLCVNLIACPIMLILSMIFRRSKVGGRQALKAKELKKHKLAGKSTEEFGDFVPCPLPPDQSLHGSQSVLEQSIVHWQSLQEWAQKQWEKRYQKALLVGEEMAADIEMQRQEQVLTLASTQSGLFFNRTDQSKVGSASDVKHLIPHSHDGDSDSIVTSSHSSLSDDTFVRTRRFYLPPSFRYIAWFLSFVIGFGSGFITVYYSKDFQEGKYSLWLQAIFVTFLFCTFIIQPLGILFKAMGTALVYRRDPTVLQHFPDRYEEDIEEIRQRFTHLTDEDEITRGTRARQRSRYLRFARPPQEKQLIAARKRTIKEKKFLKLSAEVGVVALLLLLLSAIVFHCERNKTFHLNSNIRRIMSTNSLTARHQSFVNISKPSEMWAWLENDLRDVIFSDHSHNLGSSIIIGNATKLEQVRVHAKECEAKNCMPKWAMRDVCYPPYTFYTADKQSLRLDNRTVDYYEVSTQEDAVIYGDLYSYHESGFKVLLPTTEAQFSQSLASLRESGWVDKKSRMIFIEMTIYNIPTNLYSSVTVMFELSPSGQVLPRVNVDSAKLYRYRTGWDFVVLTAEMLFIMVYLCQAHFYVIIIMQLRKRYFSQIWNILDIFYLLIALSYIVIYIYRHAIVKMLHDELRQTFHSSFVSAAPLIYWDSILRTLIGLLLFIVVLKVLKLFRYIKTFARIGNVYRRAAKDIRAFAIFFLLLIITFTNVGVALFQSATSSFSEYWRGVMTVTGYMTGSVNYNQYRETMPFWGGAYTVVISVCGYGLLTALMVAILSYHLRDFRQERILAMNMKEAFKFLKKKVNRKLRKRKEPEEEDSHSQVLSPEFALAEMEYQVDELLFKMSALCDGVSLPNKSSLYYTTDSDGTLAGGGHTGHGHTGHADDVMSSGGSNLNDKDLDQNSLTRLLHLQGIGTQIHEGDQTYRSQLEMEVLRHLQMSQTRDHNVWDELRRTDRAFSDGVTSENDIPIHREEYSNPVFHSYEPGESGQEEDTESFISIPDESYVPLAPYSPPTPPSKRNKKKDKESRNKNKQSVAQAEVYELTEQPTRRPLSPDIAYHNDAYVSDVEVELDLEFTPSPARIGGFHKKTRSKPSKNTSGSYQNQGYHEDEGTSQQTNV